MRVSPQLILVIPVIALLTGCISNPNMLGGAALGGAGGGVAGSQFGKGQGKLLATAAGALLGAGAGGYLGSFFDQTNRNSSSIQQMNQQRRIGYGSVPAPIVYRSPAPILYRAPYQNRRRHQDSIPLICEINNNRVICGSE